MNPSRRISASLLSSRLLAGWIVVLMAFAILPAAQPEPVDAQDFNEHTIIKRECPPGFDPGSGTPQNAFDNCTTLQPGAAFTLSSQDPAYQGVVRTTDVGGTTGWSDIPAGSAYSVAESLPPGYGNPWVFCRIYEQLDDSGQSVEFYFQAPGGVMDIGLSDPSLIALRDATCYWFNVPPAPAEPAEPTATAGPAEPADTATTITIQKRYCPFRYPYASATLADLQANCATPLRNISFHINDDPATRQSADGNGQVVFDPVPYGPVSIREEAYASFDTARVFCQSHPSGDTSVAFDPADEVPFTTESGDRFLVNLEATQGNRIDCLWFNAHITEEDLGSLIITKYICQEADEASFGTSAEITRRCAEPQVNAYFELVWGGGTSGGETDFNGVRQFLNYSPGAYDLRETAPAGFATARVFCYEHLSSEPVAILDSFQEYTVTNQSQVSIELKAGYDLDCAWVNIPIDANAGWVIVHKYYCHVNTNPAFASHDGLLEACDRSLVGIPFELTNEGGTYQSARTIAQNGDASWYDAPPGNLTLRETVPTGYEVARVYCGTTPQGSGAPSLMETTYTNGLAFSMAAGSIYICEFFNTHIVENTGGFVDVYKALCPPEFDNAAATTRNEFAQACSERVTGVQFDIAGPNGYARSATTDFGTAFFQEPAPPGTLTITETPAQGQTLVRVFCGEAPYIGIGAIPDEWTDYANTTQVEFDLSPGYQLVCEWYNVALTLPEAASPVAEDLASPMAGDSASPVATGSGSIVITKHLCPETTEPGGIPEAQLGTQCTELGEGFTFVFRTESGDEIDSATTGTDGQIIFVAGSEGTFRVIEPAVAGYETVAIQCNGENAYDEAASSASEYWTSPLSFAPGVTWDCDWYNQAVTEYEPGSIVIHKFDCPPGYPTEPQDSLSPLEYFSDGCKVAASGVDFNVQQGGTNVGSGETDGGGGAIINGVEPGATRISELPREGWGPPIVFCSIESTNGERTTFDEQTVDTWGHSVELAEGDILECYWFDFPNAQGEEGQPIQIIVHKFLCPAVYEVSGHTYESLTAGCTDPENAVNFDVTADDNASTSGPTDANGYVEFNGVAPGFVSVTETPREGYQTVAVYCTVYTDTAGTPSFIPTVAGQLEYYLADGYTLECYWFNIEAFDYGNVSVFKYICPEGYDYEQASRDDLSQNCTEQYEGIQYFLSGPDNYAEERSTSQFGLAEWTPIPAGSYSMHETPVSGYYPVRIFCSEVPIGSPILYEAGFSGQFEDFTASPDSILDIQLEVREGYWWWCEWYNAPVEDHGWVDVIKYVCPPDYDYASKSHEELREDCFYVAEGVEFTLANNSYAETRTTDSDGRADWDETPAETLAMSEGVPEFEPVRIFCVAAPGEGGEPPSPPWSDYSGVAEIQLDVEPQHHVYCEWFNMLDEGTLTISKYACEQAYDYVSRDDFHAACTQAQAGVHFDVSSQYGYSAAGDTDQAGLILLEGAPHAPTTMTETPPEGYMPWRVYCSAVQSEGDTPAAWDSVPVDFEVNATYPVTANSYTTCEWYNAPYVEAPPQVWIQKYTCPEEADHQWTYHQLVPECLTPAEGIRFEYKQEGGQFLEIDSDALGRAQLTGLEPDTWIITERVPDGYDGVAVFCQFITPQHAGAYQPAQVYNGEIAIELDYDYVVNCVWFNFLEGHAPPAATPPAEGNPPLQPDTSSEALPATGGAGTGVTGVGQTLPPVDPDAPATLIITKSTCQPLYDVHLEDSDPAVDCGSLTGDVTFSLSNEDESDPVDLQGITGDDGEGRVSFSDLLAGPYLLTEELPEGTLSAFIYTCESDQREFQAENPFTPFAYAGPGGRIGVTLIPGEVLECDWYNVPGEQPGGQVTIIKYACPGTSVIVAQCEVFTDGATIGLFPVGGSGESIELVTGEDGTATAAVEGTYTIQEIPTTACLIDSDAFDLAGNLVVNGGDEVEVLVYNCGLETGEGE